MKKILFMASVVLFFNSTVAQNTPDPDYDELDKILGSIDTTKINTGILYERTMQLANLYNFNLSDSLNTADYSYFKQAMLELYNASKSKKFVHSKKLVEDVESKPQFSKSDAVHFGVINADFNILASWEGSEYQGVKFDSINQKYEQIPNKPAFYMLHTTVIAPLKNAIEGASAEFIFTNDFMYSYGDKNIKSLTAFFDYEKVQPIIIGGVFTPVTVSMNYETTGTKFIKFEVEYDDGSKVTTHSSLYFRNSTIANNLLSSCNPSDVLREDFSTTALLDFKGYRTTDPEIKPKFDYRVYYSTGNTLKKLMKPIIIIDGFDPGDKRRIEDCDCEQDINCAVNFRGANGQFNPDLHRSITDIMQYFNGINMTPLLGRLRDLGFDVMIVNFPKYTTTNLENGQQVAIDGGAYYIESNAFALVKMINETNAKLATNGSTNHIAIIAPSMAGQISRYALSYMEKYNIPHNVNLWVSIDSPHLGANIPMGDQGLIYRFQISSDQAIDFYQKDLSSPASQQQLIEFHRQIGNNANPNFQNAQTTSQGLPQNRGNSFFQEHYNRQNSNGLANSNGWPQNLRKIAIVNGSLTGSKEALKLNGEPLANFAADGELVLSIRGFQKIKVFGVTVGTVHVASIESRFLPNSSTPIKISRFHKADKDRAVYAGNINNRGNMDNVPGGYFDAQDQLRKSVLKIDQFANFNYNFIGTSGYWSQREFNPIHSFIPTFSAIAHLEPNQSWNNPLDYNLACAPERKTPFDSYFGGDKNTQHTSFTKESVAWLLEELDGNPQEPYFPIQNDALTGPSIVCKNTNAVFSFLEVCKLPGAVETWSVEGNLSIVTSTDFTVTVIGTSDVFTTGKIIATFHNGVRYEKTVSLGKPKVTLHVINGGNDNVVVGATSTFSVSAENATQYYWFISTLSSNCGCVTNSQGLTICPPNTTFPKFSESNATTFTSSSPSAIVNWGNCQGSYVVNCRAVNSCGTTDISYKIVNVYNSSGGGGSDPCGPTLQVNPNPIANGNITINLIPEPGDPCNDNVGEKINDIKIYDLYGNQVFSESYNTDTLNISGLNLEQGNYILNVFTSKGHSKREIIIVE